LKEKGVGRRCGIDIEHPELLWIRVVQSKHSVKSSKQKASEDRYERFKV
jgi:hypothetical protein